MMVSTETIHRFLPRSVDDVSKILFFKVPRSQQERGLKKTTFSLHFGYSEYRNIARSIRNWIGPLALPFEGLFAVSAFLTEVSNDRNTRSSFIESVSLSIQIKIALRIRVEFFLFKTFFSVVSLFSSSL